jgi:glycosyltransferase domain-containing protein
MPECSIIIPTHNRQDYLSRILTYYAGFKEKFKIIIADSSDGKTKKINEKIIASMSNLDIKNLNFYSPKIKVTPKITNAIDYVRTKYCVFCADDDFITPNGMHKSIEFLRKNSDFSVAHGSYIKFYLNTNYREKQRFLWRPIYPHKSLTSEDPKNRLTSHLLNYYPTFYAIHRTNLLKTIYKETSFSKVEPVRFGELLPSALTLLYGKMKCLDIIYAVRDGGSSGGKAWPSLFDFMKKDKYRVEYSRFKQCLSENLCRKIKLSIGQSEELIDNAMAVYMKKNRETRNNKTYKIKESLDKLKLPGWADKNIRAMYRKLFLRELKQKIPNSGYYEDLNKIKAHLLSYSKNHHSQ